jgi:DNA polymerase III delta subunit
MIKILEGDLFQINEFLEGFLEKKFVGVDEEKRNYSIIRNPKRISAITEISAFSLQERVILWDWNNFKKLETFNPYVIPRGTDIFIVGEKIDKRLRIYKSLQAHQAEHTEFKPLYPNQVEGWILNRKDKLELKIRPEAIKLLALMYGTNLGELSNFLQELKKSEIPVITKEVILERGTTVNEFSVFELHEDICFGRTTLAIFKAKQMLKSGEQAFGLIRYLISFFDKLFKIKIGLVDGLNLHPFILKKLKDLPVSAGSCLDSLEILRLAEVDLLKGLKEEYVTSYLIYNIIRR